MFEVSSQFEIEKKKSQNRNFLSVRAITVNHERGRREERRKRDSSGQQEEELVIPEGM